jgi:hypothetical protein
MVSVRRNENNAMWAQYRDQVMQTLVVHNYNLARRVIDTVDCNQPGNLLALKYLLLGKSQ